MGDLAEIKSRHADKVRLAYASHASIVSDGTQATYRGRQRTVQRWLAEHGIKTVPEITVDAVLALMLDRADNGYTFGSIEHDKLAISRLCLESGLPDVTVAAPVRRMLRILKRRLGEAPRDPSMPLRLDRLEVIALHLVERIASEGDPAIRLRHRRDLAMILTQWKLGLRHFQLLALRLGDLRVERKGYLFSIPVEKGRPQGVGRRMPLYRDDDLRHLCAVRAIEEWLEVAQIHEGPLFRAVVGRGGKISEDAMSLRAYRDAVKRCAEGAGFVGEELRRTRTHSMRRGVGTEMLAQGRLISEVQHHLNHASVRTTEGYIEREARLAEYPDPIAGLRPRRTTKED